MRSRTPNELETELPESIQISNINELDMLYDNDRDGFGDDINLFDETSADLDDLRDFNYSDNNESNITLEEADNAPYDFNQKKIY
jgi:hypothetical protein